MTIGITRLSRSLYKIPIIISHDQSWLATWWTAWVIPNCGWTRSGGGGTSRSRPVAPKEVLASPRFGLLRPLTFPYIDYIAAAVIAGLVFPLGILLRKFVSSFNSIDVAKSVVVVLYNQCSMNLVINSKIIHGKFTQEPITPGALGEGYPTTAVAVNVS